MNQRVLLTVLAILAVGGGLWWFFANHERVDEEVFSGLRGEARYNSLLAAQRFVGEISGDRIVQVARSLGDLEEGLPEGGVLMLTSNRTGMSERHFTSIVNWVERGGLLIVEVNDSSGSDKLAEKLALDLEVTQWRQTELTVKLPWLPGESFKVKLPGSVTVDYYGAEKPAFAIDDDAGRRVVGFELGEGKVIATGSFLAFENSIMPSKEEKKSLAIGYGDNAPLLWGLMQWNENTDGDILFFQRAGKLSIWDWLVANALFALIAFGAGLALWLWRTAVRFGPVAPDPVPARRRLTDHLIASGRFLWRRRATAPLIEAARELALRRMTRLVPEFTALDPPAKVAALEQSLGFSRAQANAAVSGGAANPSEILELVRLFHRIHTATRSPA